MPKEIWNEPNLIAFLEPYDWIENLMVSIISSVTLWYSPCYKKYAKLRQQQYIINLRQNKSGLSLIAEQILAFAFSTNLVREDKKFSAKLKLIA